MEESYTVDVQSKSIEVREKLQTLSKERLTISQYMFKGKTIAGILATFGDPIIDKDMLLYVLRGLGPCYNNFCIKH